MTAFTFPAQEPLGRAVLRSGSEGFAMWRWVLVVVIVGCSSGGPTDAGVPDAALDAGGEDAGRDAGGDDGGLDAGGHDGGSDAGTDGGNDAGTSDAGSCVRILGRINAPAFPPPFTVTRGAPWNHRPRVRTSRYATDVSWVHDPSTWTLATFVIDGGLPGPTITGLDMSKSVIARPSGLEVLSSAFFPAVPDGRYLKVFRGLFDETTGSAIFDLLAASDAGSFGAGATWTNPSGDTVMCGAFADYDGGEALGWSDNVQMVFFDYGPATGSGAVVHFTGIPAGTCRELSSVDGGYLAHVLQNSGNADSEFVNPHMRSQFLRFTPGYSPVDGGASNVDAGFCITESRDPLSGWCDDLSRREVLRFDSWFQNQPPTSIFRHDGGVTVIAEIQGHLVIGINEQHTGDGYARYDVGWLRDGGFELIKASQVVPLGYGPWSTTSAAFTFIRPDLTAWDVLESDYDCP
ncbi:MAG: hypothetical protein Q8K32_28825 [Archangium sp.]|nr:hypothetical protein [Archangium sp.]